KSETRMPWPHRLHRISVNAPRSRGGRSWITLPMLRGYKRFVASQWRVRNSAVNSFASGGCTLLDLGRRRVQSDHEGGTASGLALHAHLSMKRSGKVLDDG